MIGIERNERAHAWTVIILGWLLAAWLGYAVVRGLGWLWARLGAVSVGGGS